MIALGDVLANSLENCDKVIGGRNNAAVDEINLGRECLAEVFHVLPIGWQILNCCRRFRMTPFNVNLGTYGREKAREAGAERLARHKHV